jgi:hypothetical protein
VLQCVFLCVLVQPHIWLVRFVDDRLRSAASIIQRYNRRNNGAVMLDQRTGVHAGQHTASLGMTTMISIAISQNVTSPLLSGRMP